MNVENNVLTSLNTFQLKRGTSAVLSASDYVPETGEVIAEIDTGQIKVGNGVDTWNNLSYVGDVT